MKSKKEPNTRNYNQVKDSLAEKVSFSISLFIVSLVVVLICYSWITGDTDPPIVAIISQVEIQEVDRQYYVPFTVSNSGGSTAESVEVVAQLKLASGELETGRQQINFLSRGEQRSGKFIFSSNPNQGQLKIRVASYKLP